MLPLVTKEQAILLKEVGYNLDTTEYYYKDSTLDKIDGTYSDLYSKNWNGKDRYYSAPTVSEALLWLEDNKGVRFFVEDNRSNAYKHLINGDYNITIIYGKMLRRDFFTEYNSRLFQSKQLSMALEILKTTKQ